MPVQRTYLWEPRWGIFINNQDGCRWWVSLLRLVVGPYNCSQRNFGQHLLIKPLGFDLAALFSIVFPAQCCRMLWRNLIISLSKLVQGTSRHLSQQLETWLICLVVGNHCKTWMNSLRQWGATAGSFSVHGSNIYGWLHRCHRWCLPYRISISLPFTDGLV